MDKKEVNILKELGKQLAEIAADDINKKKIKLWKKLNSLEDTRPMVMIDQLPWNELNVNDELTIMCKDPFLQKIEAKIRQKIYKWKHFKGDMVVHNWVDIPKSVSNTKIGPSVKQDIAVLDESNSVVGHKYYDMIPNEEELEKIKTPKVQTDPELDKKHYEIANEIFDGIIPVHMTGVTVHAGIWDRLTTLRGADAIIYDVIDRPEFTLKIINKFVSIAMNILDQYENLNLLEKNQPSIHCTGAYNKDLLANENRETNTKAQDTWAFAMAQIFSTVSPKMHDRFEIQPLKPYLERFGLIYYGCCEPLDRKIDIIRKIKNVRKISVSPWADKERAASNIAGDYVFSNKPNPAYLAETDFDPDLIKKDLQETVKICKQNNTPCELILKDISTVKYQPERLVQWEKIAMEVVNSQ